MDQSFSPSHDGVSGAEHSTRRAGATDSGYRSPAVVLRTVLLVVLALAAQACGGGNESKTGARSEGASSSSASSTTTTTEPADEVQVLSLSAPLEPDDYKTAEFNPALALTVGSGLEIGLDEREDNFALLETRPGAQGWELMGVTFVRLTNTFDDPFLPTGVLEEQVPGLKDHIVPVPDDLVAWLRGIPGVSVTEPTSLKVAGQPATRFDVTIGPLPSQALQTCPPGIPAEVGGCVALSSVEEGEEALLITAGDRQRWTVVTVNGERLLISFGGPKDRFDSFVATGQAVVDSVRLQQP